MELVKVSLKEAVKLMKRGLNVRAFDNVTHLRYDFLLIPPNDAEHKKSSYIYGLDYEDVAVLSKKKGWDRFQAILSEALRVNKEALTELTNLISQDSRKFKIEKDRVSIEVDTRDRAPVEILRQVITAAEANITTITQGEKKQ